MAEFGNPLLRLNEIRKFANLAIWQSRFESWQFAIHEFGKSRERFNALGCGALEGRHRATLWEKWE